MNGKQPGRTRRLVAAAVVAAVTSGLIPAATAQDLSRPEWEARLADTARGGPVPAVESVEGRAIDVSLLGTGDQRRSRAAAALGGTTVEPLDPDVLADRAQRILSQPAYAGESQSVWRRWLTDNPIARWVRDVWNRFVRWVLERLSFGGQARDPATGDPNRSSYGLPFLIAVMLGAGLLAARIGRRRRAQERERIEWFHGIDDVARTPESLEQKADAAERAGDLTSAVRFRFLAGLLRLEAGNVIDFRPSITMRELRAAVDRPPFAVAADIFERAAYAPHPVGEADAARHRRAWDELLGARR